MIDRKPFACILDDDDAFRLLLSRILEMRGFFVKTFSDSDLFFSSVKDKLPELCFIDLNINQIEDGLSVVESIRSEFQVDIPVFVVSETCNQMAFKHALMSGATDYLVKPLNPDVFNKKLSKVFPKINVQIEHPNLLPSYLVGHQITIDVDFKMIEINEYGIKFKGKHFLKRGLTLNFAGSLITSILGSNIPLKVIITQSEFDHFTQDFNYCASFETPSVSLLTAVRLWIRSQSASNKFKSRSIV
jgi:DNA-binding response OmpR family regulator